MATQVGLPATLAAAVAAAADHESLGVWGLFLLQLSARLRIEEYGTMAFLCFGPRAPCQATQLLRALGSAANNALLLLQPPLPPAGAGGPLNRQTAYVVTWQGGDSPCRLVEGLTNSSRAALVLLNLGEGEGGEYGNVADAERAFQACWHHRFPNVVAAFAGAPADGNLSLYTYEPFTPGACNTATPRSLGTWNPTSPLHSLKEVGLARKGDNLNRCALRVGTLDIKPWSYAVWDQQLSLYRFGGSLLPLVDALSQCMNFTVIVSLSEHSMTLGRAETCPDCEGLYGDLFHNRSDVAVLMTYKRSIPTPYHVQILTSQTSCSTWCLPTGYRARSITHLLLDEFSPRAWLALCVTTLLAAWLLHALSAALPVRTRTRVSWGLAGLLAVRALLGSPAPLPTAPHALRVFFLGWSFFSTIMGTLYGAVLRSYIVAARDATVFTAVEDIVEAGIPFYLPAERMHFFHDPPLSDTGSEGEVMRRALPFAWEDAPALLLNFTRRRDLSVFLERDTCLSLARLHTPARQPAAFHVLRGHCGPLLRRTMSFVTVLQRSPLLGRLRELLARLDEAGLTAYWTRSPHAPATQSGLPAASPLRVAQLLPFYLLLVAGLFAAGLAFLGELVAHRLAANRRQ